MHDLHTQIHTAIGRQPTNLQSLSGGMIGQVYRVTLSDGETIVAKTSTDTDLDIEGYMLTYLKENSQLPVPTVLHRSPDLLLMTVINGSSTLSAAAQAHAGELLAALHSITAPHFGLERDTLIGSLHQPNPKYDSWIAFFREQRLLHMGKKAVDEGSLPPAIFSRLETFCGRLDRYIAEPDQPSLIHGDMWTTNILADGGKITGFIDPAIYYAHPEIELAFSTLFNTFNKAFFDSYASIRPIAPGFFEQRRDIYNLYPLLVHVRLFGGGYVRSMDAILKGLGF